MKKVFLSLFLIFSFGAYVLLNPLKTQLGTSVASITGQGTPPNNLNRTPIMSGLPPTVQNPNSPVPQPTPTPAPDSSRNGLVDGTYTGDPADAYYGIVQVSAVIQGGNISDVRFLQHPSDRRTSQNINSYAMPILTQETVQAQSANVDTVSGASATSEAFRQSLASALAQAK